MTVKELLGDQNDRLQAPVDHLEFLNQSYALDALVLGPAEALGFA